MLASCVLIWGFVWSIISIGGGCGFQLGTWMRPLHRRDLGSSCRPSCHQQRTRTLCAVLEDNGDTDHDVISMDEYSMTATGPTLNLVERGESSYSSSLQDTMTPQPPPATTTTSIEYLATFNQTLKFASYDELMNLRVGEFVTSQRFTLSTTPSNGEAAQEYDFCVKLYPRGGGHKAIHTISQPKTANEVDESNSNRGGFGMSYAVTSSSRLTGLPSWLPFGSNHKEEDVSQQKVGVYLQFLPRREQDTVDASFALRLKGKQRSSRRFDVEWRSGIRFVSLDQSNLRQGQANDFGAHLMQTGMLDFFLGIARSTTSDDENETRNDANAKEPVEVQVEVYLHKPLGDSTASPNALQINQNEGLKGVTERGRGGIFSGMVEDVRDTTTTSPIDNNTQNGEPLRVGRIVVPVLRKLSERPRMFQAGVYPGVEYRLLRIINEKDQDLFYNQPDVDYELKPIYPLVRQLERPWPVRIKEQDIPKLITPTQYNVISAVGSLFAATTALLMAFIISQAISLFFIPSKSMEPTLLKGDVVVVEKVTPRLSSLHLAPSLGIGDVVLFHPPNKLQELVMQSGGSRIKDRDLFVKRIAAVPGDSVAVVDRSGTVLINGERPKEDRNLCSAEPLRLIEQYMKPGGENDFLVEPQNVAVLGDCSSVSVDSRVWQSLPTQDIVGRPLIRIWPPARVGPIESLPQVVDSSSSTKDSTNESD